MQVTLGDLVSIYYAEYLALYGDEDMALRATVRAILNLLEAE